MKSVLSNDKECYICRTEYSLCTTHNLHRHHVFGGTANRKKSEKEGCWVYLCAPHHNMSNKGVHFDQEANLKLKKKCQAAWMAENDKSIDEFRKRFGKNYLDED